LDGYITAQSASVQFALASHNHAGVYAPIDSAVTTAQLNVYLLSQDASTTYARQASAVTTAQLTPYLLSNDASTIYARQTSAVTTAQLGVYLLSQDASTTYARQASAVTTAQLAVYILSQDASTTYARQVSALTTAQGDARYMSVGAVVSTINMTETSADFRYGQMKFVAADISSQTIASLVTIPELIFSVSASVAYRFEYQLVYRSSAAATNIAVGVSCTPTPGVFMCAADIYGQATDGTGAVFSGYASANGDIILGTSTNLAAVDLPIQIQATIVTGAAGQVQCVFRSEVSNSNVVIRRGSSARMNRLGAV
jgi:hypothetical protein